MKKIGFLFVVIGLGLLVYGLVAQDVFGGKLTDSSGRETGQFTNTVTKNIYLKHLNYNNPTVEYFTFPVELSCDYPNEFSFSCDNYSTKTNREELTLSVRASTTRYGESVSFDTLTDTFREKISYYNGTVTVLDKCSDNMLCLKGVYNYDDSNEQTRLYVAISNKDGYYTIIDYYISNSKGAENHALIDKYIDSFISSIVIDSYVENEGSYKDNMLDISLTVPRFNDVSEIKLYLDKDKYRYNDSQYLNSNNLVYVYLYPKKENGMYISYYVTIKYLYKAENYNNEDLLTLFSSGTNIATFAAEKIMVGDKEVYHNTDDRRFFLHIINEHYAYYVESTTSLSDSELLDLFDFKYE